jgi:excisionase family DNA binding protein
MPGELLVTLDEAGRRLSLCRRSVQSLIYEGQLPSVKVGRSRRVAVTDLEAFVAHLRHDGDHPELRVVARTETA